MLCHFRSHRPGAGAVAARRPDRTRASRRTWARPPATSRPADNAHDEALFEYYFTSAAGYGDPGGRHRAHRQNRRFRVGHDVARWAVRARLPIKRPFSRL